MALINQKGEEWLTRGAEDRSSNPGTSRQGAERDHLREGRDLSKTVRGWEEKSGGKMDTLCRVNMEKKV